MIFLLTDFGLENHYAGVMKAVILAHDESIRIVDLTHGIAPGAVADAAFELWAVWPYIAVGSVVVAVVDPGVGTQRRALALRAGSRFLVGPDNGIFSDVLAVSEVDEAVMLAGPQHENECGATFDGRDIFAPAAARIATGTSLADLGKRIDPMSLTRLAIEPAATVGDSLFATVRRIDRFGNVITNCGASLFGAWRRGTGRLMCIGGAGAFDVDFVSAYAESVPGTLAALINSSGLLELAVNGGRASELIWGEGRLRVGIGCSAGDSARRLEFRRS